MRDGENQSEQRRRRKMRKRKRIIWAVAERRLSFQAFTLVTGYGRHAPAARRSPHLSLPVYLSHVLIYSQFYSFGRRAERSGCRGRKKTLPVGISPGFFKVRFGSDSAATWETRRAFGQNTWDEMKQEDGGQLFEVRDNSRWGVYCQESSPRQSHYYLIMDTSKGITPSILWSLRSSFPQAS